MEVTDKRAKESEPYELTPKTDAWGALLGKVFKFVSEQPEFYKVLELPRPLRRKLGQEVGAIMTTFPHFSKVQANYEEA